MSAPDARGLPPPERMSPREVAELDKRITLNLLIQGAATHTFFTAHHLVRDDLDAIDHRLVPRYDRIVPSMFLNAWIGDLLLLCGRPSRVWKRITKGDHPLHRCKLLREHGAALAEASRQWTVDRAKQTGVFAWQPAHYPQSLWLQGSVTRLEWRHRPRLTEIAVDAASRIWGIDPHRLDGALTFDVEFGELQAPRGSVERMLRFIAAGYSGIEPQGVDPEGRPRLGVVARAVIWPLLIHELVKGVAELVCLHGWNRLDAATYEAVRAEADRLSYEVWCMQAGAELWRRFLTARPPDQSLAQSLMLVARLGPDALESVMAATATDPSAARSAYPTIEPPDEA